MRLTAAGGGGERAVARVGVNVGSIQGWEAGGNYPGLASLKALIAAGLRADGFTAGREREEAAEPGPPRGEHGPVLKRVTQRSV
jgi:hypothetical protein